MQVARRRISAPGHGRHLQGGVDVTKATCFDEGCDRPIEAREWCRMHYMRRWRQGELTRRALADRLWSRVTKGDNCWEWTGARNHKGYGEIGADGRVQKAHRIAWVLTYGPIHDGVDVLHRCDNPPCCRPDHLFLGDDADNMADMVRKGRSKQSQRTHCPQGHPYDEENTYISYRGAGRAHRQCKECSRQRVRERRARKRAERTTDGR